MLDKYIGKIINADCLDILRQLPDKSIDLLLTDPPYGIGMHGGQIGSRGHVFPKKNWDKKIPDKDVFTEMFRVSKNQIIWGGNYFGLPPSRSWIVWDKGETYYKMSFSDAELAYTSFDKNVRIFKYNPIAHGDYHNKIHPTQKPLSLFHWCLENYSKEGDLVLDCFSGSGTTAIACRNLHRKFICIEKDPDYWEASVKRLEKEEKQQILPLYPPTSRFFPEG